MRAQHAVKASQAGARHVRPRALAVVACALLGVAGLTACTSVRGHADPHVSLVGPTASASAPASVDPPTPAGPAPAAVITTTPAKHTAVNPVSPVTVAVAGGRLASVQLVNHTGKVVSGAMSDDASSWHATEVLGYGKSYTLSADAVNLDGKHTTKVEHFTTLTPGNMTLPYFQTIGGYALHNGATYGVAFVPIVHFDEPIPDKAAAEKALQVTSSPHVDGSWYWVDDKTLHYRPKGYWPSGTKVTIKAQVYGVEVGPGLFGQSDKSISFTIGRYQKTIADDTRKGAGRVKVYNAAGHVIRTMDTSMGRHGGTHVNGNYINYFTLDGAYTVIHFENPANMCSSTYGLPADAPGGYPCEKIPWATKISVDGIYLHQLNTTIWAQKQGEDVSHGCLNLKHADAEWYYKHSLIGDPVVVKGAKGAPKLQLWQGGDWSVPWSTWVKGSALS